jgi:hypothetical protein
MGLTYRQMIPTQYAYRLPKGSIELVFKVKVLISTNPWKFFIVAEVSKLELPPSQM